MQQSSHAPLIGGQLVCDRGWWCAGERLEGSVHCKFPKGVAGVTAVVVEVAASLDTRVQCPLDPEPGSKEAKVVPKRTDHRLLWCGQSTHKVPHGFGAADRQWSFKVSMALGTPQVPGSVQWEEVDHPKREASSARVQWLLWLRLHRGEDDVSPVLDPHQWTTKGVDLTQQSTPLELRVMAPVFAPLHNASTGGTPLQVSECKDVQRKKPLTMETSVPHSVQWADEPLTVTVRMKNGSKSPVESFRVMVQQRITVQAQAKKATFDTIHACMWNEPYFLDADSSDEFTMKNDRVESVRVPSFDCDLFKCEHTIACEAVAKKKPILVALPPMHLMPGRPQAQGHQSVFNL